MDDDSGGKFDLDRVMRRSFDQIYSRENRNTGWLAIAKMILADQKERMKYIRYYKKLQKKNKQRGQIPMVYERKFKKSLKEQSRIFINKRMAARFTMITKPTKHHSTIKVNRKKSANSPDLVQTANLDLNSAGFIQESNAIKGK